MPQNAQHKYEGEIWFLFLFSMEISNTSTKRWPCSQMRSSITMKPPQCHPSPPLPSQHLPQWRIPAMTPACAGEGRGGVASRSVPCGGRRAGHPGFQRQEFYQHEQTTPAITRTPVAFWWCELSTGGASCGV